MNKLIMVLIFLGTLILYKFSSAANLCKMLVHNSQAPNYSPEITVIIGTDRQGSKSALVANEIINLMAQNPNVKINLIDLEKLPKSIFKSDYFAKKSPQFVKNFVDPIDRAGGIIFIVPEYDGAVPGILSYYMNHMRLSLDKKQVALIGISAGKWGARAALDGFKGTLTHRRARILGDLQINIENIDGKFENDKLTNVETKNRISETVNEIAKSIKQAQDAEPPLSQMAEKHSGQNIELKLNNGNSIEGKLTEFVVSENGKSLDYVQFSGPTKIKHKGQLIPGQDIDVHSQGYGMPVGAIKNFRPAWFKKENLSDANLEVGKKIKLIYESGISVSGKIKKLTYDAEDNLIVITFTDAVARNSENVFFQKDWGDFDVAVGDFIAQISQIN